jgi:hypothetical protein
MQNVQTIDCTRPPQARVPLLEQQGRSERSPEAYLFTRPPRTCQRRLFTRGRYVEGLSDARTKLQACFNILLKVSRHV